MNTTEAAISTGEGAPDAPAFDLQASLSDLADKGRRVGGYLKEQDLMGEGRLLLARAERGMARGLRLAAKQLDHAAFRLDCAGRKLASTNGQGSSPTASKPASKPAASQMSDDEMEDGLVSPHLA